MECSVNQRVGAQIPEDDQEDPFKRLPDELIISHILDKISEAKSLFFISLVSNHFSSLVFQTHDVSLRIPLQNPDHVGVHTDNFEQPSITTYPLFWPGKFVRFVTAPVRLVHWLLCSILQRSSRPLPLPPSTGFNSEFLSQIPIKFLTKFTSMRSLYLEYDNSGPGLITSKNEPLVRWTVHPKASAYILLYGWNFLDFDHDSQDLESFVANEGESLALHFNYQMKTAASIFTLLEMLVPSLSKPLKKLVVTDTKKQSKVDLGEDDVAELRNLNVDFENFKASIRIWFAPLLVLPLSGCVFRMVTLCMYKDSESDYDDFLIAKEAFDGEDETVFAEAATELVKKEVVYEKIL